MKLGKLGSRRGSAAENPRPALPSLRAGGGGGGRNLGTVGAIAAQTRLCPFHFKESHSHKCILGGWAPMGLAGSKMERKWHMALVVLAPPSFPKHPCFSLVPPGSPARPRRQQARTPSGWLSSCPGTEDFPFDLFLQEQGNTASVGSFASNGSQLLSQGPQRCAPPNNTRIWELGRA